MVRLLLDDFELSKNIMKIFFNVELFFAYETKYHKPDRKVEFNIYRLCEFALSIRSASCSLLSIYFFFIENNKTIYTDQIPKQK